MRHWQKAIAATTASLFFLSTTALTAVEAGAALRETRQLTVQQGPVRGSVVNSEGKGLDKAVVDVRDAKGDVVSAAVTKKDGSFCLASVPAGEYALSVNGELTYALHVAKDAQTDSVSLVAPSQARYSAGQEESGMSTTTKVAAGLGVAALVGLAVVLSDDDDDDGDDCQ